ENIIKALVKQSQTFAGLKALFLGDIISEENEISWIEQSDVSPLLKAFPLLEVFRVRGGNHLSFTKVKHAALKQLIVEAGGLPRSVIREICRCDFPNLEHLELWLGVENYGWDGGVEDLQPLLAGNLFPKLTYLGLRNSDIADDIAPVVVNAPILKRLKVLDLSNGTLSDIGARALLKLPANLPLKKLSLTHHYMTEPVVKQLRKTLSCKVIADDAQDPDEEWHSVVVSE
ncbi:MAG TPA: STM4015 family protein, partial [Gemmataceae bacterium]|nr:STM4015 family protein [Gemmataceae bacterium]